MSGLFPVAFETDRLAFERVCHDNVDLFEFYAVRGPEADRDGIAEYLPWEPHRTPKETADLLDRAESEWDEGEAARYVLRAKSRDSGRDPPIGYTKLDIDWPRRTGRLGVWLRKRFWGHGFSGERADALLALAFDRLSLEVVAVAHQDGNERSRRAVEKYVDRHGGRYEGLSRNRQRTTNGTADVHRYTITAEQYATAEGSRTTVEFPGSR